MTLTVALRHRLPGFGLELAFETPAGVTALFGRSGSGKTTVINAVAGLVRPDQGRVVLNGAVLLDTEAGRDVPVHRRRLGYVFQDGRLFPHLTVRQNLIYGYQAGGADLGHIIELLGIGALLDRRPGTLSGGEKQRVAIGRALLTNPALLLMDEPLAALDEARKAEILPYLERLRDETRIPILYVSHSVAEVARLANRILVIEAGGIVREGPAAEVLADPAAVPALGVREAGAILTARVVAREADGLARLETAAGPLWLPGVGAAPGATVRVRIAAQDVILSRARPEGLSALNILPATVAALRLGEGPGALVQLKVGEDLILARITRRSAAALQLAPGERVHAILKAVAVGQADIGTG